MTWLKGKKTYIVAALGILISLVEFLSVGDFSLASLIALFQQDQVALLAATIRAGIGNK